MTVETSEIKQQPSEAPETILQVFNLSKHFEGLKAIDEVNFSIKQGELI